MALTLGMLLPPRYAPWHATLPGHATAPLGMLLPLWKGLQLGQSALKQVTFAHQLFNFQKKVTVWGGKISSQNSTERLLISSPPSKMTLKKKKLIFLVHFFFSRF